MLKTLASALLVAAAAAGASGRGANFLGPFSAHVESGAEFIGPAGPVFDFDGGSFPGVPSGFMIGVTSTAGLSLGNAMFQFSHTDTQVMGHGTARGRSNCAPQFMCQGSAVSGLEADFQLVESSEFWFEDSVLASTSGDATVLLESLDDAAVIISSSEVGPIDEGHHILPPGPYHLIILVGASDAVANGLDETASWNVTFNIVPAPPVCPGDADGDHQVNFADVTNVLTLFGTDYSPGTGEGDADHNGMVNFSDITAVLTFWLQPCA